jgi:Flp pilus assembly secretin CpaC
MITVTKSQHMRMSLPNDVMRFAVGDPEILSAEPIGTRELLVLGRGGGRTTMIVWFRNGTVQEYLVTVQRDLSVLQSALRRLHPSINAEIAPDRDAVILSGVVPDLSFSLRAAALAEGYLSAGSAIAIPAAGQVAIPQAAPPAPDAQTNQTTGQPPAQPQPQVQPPSVQPTGAVINLIQLETLPPTPEEKIRQAIQGIGGANVTIRRILKGPVRDDSSDTLVLEGTAPNQVALIRILSLASQILVGQAATENDIRVIADESGALTTGAQTPQGTQTLFGGGRTNSLFGGASGTTNLQNQVRRNLARAKAIEISGGRLISFLNVADVPQVRVGVRIYEISRNRLRSFSPNLAVVVSDFNQPGLLSAPNGPARAVGAGAPLNAATRTAFQNVLAFLGGSFANELQLTSGHFAIDAVLSYLERVGIARSLSTPSLTVLSGEQAIFQVGGEIPIQEAFAPFATGGAVPGTALLTTFITTTFVSFGVQLTIRPLVGDDDTITLDVQPQVVQPNTLLTAVVRESSGTNPATTAFQTRALRTSARLQDGQALLIGGLVSRDTNDNQASTPGLRSVPGLGWLFRDIQRVDDSTDLVLVINPAVLRDPAPAAQIWQYPDREELLKDFSPRPQ